MRSGTADRKWAERRASEIEHDIRVGIHGWKSTIPSFAEWWAILGHSSVAVTEAHYAHLLKDDLVAASKQVKIAVAPRGGGNVVPMPRRERG